MRLVRSNGAGGSTILINGMCLSNVKGVFREHGNMVLWCVVFGCLSGGASDGAQMQ